MPPMHLVVFFTSIPLASGLFMLWLESHAPEGYEDEHGFHFGPEPKGISVL